MAQKASQLTAASAFTGAETFALISSGADRLGTLSKVFGAGTTMTTLDRLASTDLNAIVTVVGSTVTHLIIDRPVTVPSNTTVPATLRLHPIAGGLITVSNAVTLTINSKWNPPAEKWFTLTGTGLVAFGRGTVQAVCPEWWGAVGDTTTGSDGTDDTTPMRQALAVAEVDATWGGRYLDLQATKYRLTAALIPTKRDVYIRGKGMYLSALYYNGVAAGCIVPAAAQYCRPNFSDFSIVGDASSGDAINFDAITVQTYNGVIERLAITSGGKCITSQKFFSMQVNNVYGTSINDHCFHLHMGPSVKLSGLYAISCGTGKAGYRLSGSIYMDACNGLNTGDYWGVFGSDTGGVADTFENDFTGIAYPDITLINCNVESFTLRGIYVCQSHAQFSMIGGKLDRNALSSDYHSIVSFKKSPIASTGPARFRVGYIAKGTGVPNGGGVLTNAWLHSLVGSAQVIDENGVFALSSITGVYSTAVSGLYPLLTAGYGGDGFQNTAQTFNCVSPRRINLQMIKYDQPAALTPVGSNQAIVVTGYAKVRVTPAAGATISTATFVTTLGIISDVGRNGDLIIEATNANLTVVHTALGGAANTFVMKAAADLVMGTGQVIRFLRSETTSQWIQY